MDDESSRSVRLVIFPWARYAVNEFRSWPETQNDRNNYSLYSQNRNNSHPFSLQLVTITSQAQRAMIDWEHEDQLLDATFD